MTDSPEETARLILEVVPSLMKEIRMQMRSRSSPELTVPQFRALAFVDRNEGASLSAVATHMGLTLPSMCRLVDGLIARGMVTREERPTDRRCIELAVTRRGQTILKASREGTLSYLADIVSGLSSDDRGTISQAMKALQLIFTDEAKIVKVAR